MGRNNRRDSDGNRRSATWLFLDCDTAYGGADHYWHSVCRCAWVLSSPIAITVPRAKDPHYMTISMYKTSVPIFVQFLTSMSAVLDKAAAHCEAKKIEPATLLNMRLYPDMFPLMRQLRAVTDHAISGTARLAGAELITFPNNETSFPEVKDRIAKTIEFIKSFKPEQINGTEDKEIVVKFSSVPLG